MTDRPLCKDCVHIVKMVRCVHPLVAPKDLVTGEPELRLAFEERAKRFFGKCGAKGKLFEPMAGAD